MSGKWPQPRRPRAVRSAAQQFGSAAFTEVMRAWEDLTDEERLTWRVEAKTRRTDGITYFKKVNLLRRRRGEELARVPPPRKPYDGNQVLKRLEIHNHAGRITLKLHLCRVPATLRTVWGAFPCNRGLEKPDKCPRLGWLPAPKNLVSEITALYYEKYAQRIWNSKTPLAGKRIFIRLREESDDQTKLYEGVAAIVPEPEPRAKGQKSPIPFEAPSEHGADNSRPPRSSAEAGPIPGRASVCASPGFYRNLRNSGLARTLALPGEVWGLSRSAGGINLAPRHHDLPRRQDGAKRAARRSPTDPVVGCEQLAFPARPLRSRVLRINGFLRQQD